MKYIVGTNQKIKLYIAKFSSRWGYFLCKNNIQNATNGIADHNTKPTASGIFGHNTLFVPLLWNISFLYSTLLTLDTRYGAKIKVASNINNPPGTAFIVDCAINIARDGNVKNIKFQKLSLFNLALIKLCIIIPDFIDILHSHDIKQFFKKLCFSKMLVGLVNNLIRHLSNRCKLAINNIGE